MKRSIQSDQSTKLRWTAFPSKLQKHEGKATSFEFPMHCKLPSTKNPKRSHRNSASSMECAGKQVHQLVSKFIKEHTVIMLFT